MNYTMIYSLTPAQFPAICLQHSRMFTIRLLISMVDRRYTNDIVEFAGKVPAINYGAYYNDIRSALTDAITNVVQNGADIDEEIQNAQDAVEFNISE